MFGATDRYSSLIPAKAGIGLRFQHHQAVLDTRPDIAWMEVHTENYMGGGSPIRCLEAIRRDIPISLHGVGLSLGSAEGLDQAHLDRIRQVAERIEPALMSEHIAWSVSNGTYLADLLPLPMTDAAARTGCDILCDINNIFVSAKNHGWDASAYVAALPAEVIGEIHLAGHSVRQLADGGNLRIDDHGSCVADEVWSLYAEALRRFGPIPTLIEWDNNIPPLEVLLAQARHADTLIGRENELRHAVAA